MPQAIISCRQLDFLGFSMKFYQVLHRNINPGRVFLMPWSAAGKTRTEILVTRDKLARRISVESGVRGAGIEQFF